MYVKCIGIYVKKKMVSYWDRAEDVQEYLPEFLEADTF